MKNLATSRQWYPYLRVVPLADAGSQPFAMMVKAHHAIVAGVTVSGSSWAVDITGLAVTELPDDGPIDIIVVDFKASKVERVIFHLALDEHGIPLECHFIFL